MLKCILCNSTILSEIKPDKDKRFYHLCNSCGIIFADPAFFPNNTASKKRYDSHNNGPGNVEYMSFLKQILGPALKFINPGMNGLDFGCGPFNLVSDYLKSKHISCDNYDPFYGFKPSHNKYDFVFLVEVAEHFKNPLSDWQILSNYINPSGYLFIMTELWKSKAHFANWHYKTDFTHVCFYGLESIAYISKQFGFKILKSDGTRVIIMQKL